MTYARKQMILPLVVAAIATRSAWAADSVVELRTQIRAAILASRPAIPVAMNRIEALAETGEYRLLGLKSPSESHTIHLDSPLPVFEIYLDELTRYDPERTKLVPMIHPVGEVTYLVMRPDGSVASKAVVAKSEGRWQAASLGSVIQSMRIFESLPHSVSPPATEEPARFLLEVSALHVVFIGTLVENSGSAVPDGESQILLKVVSSGIPEIGEGQSGSAADFFRTMKRVAQTTPDLPV